MKIINGVISTILSIVSGYLMFTSKTDIDLGIGFILLLMAMLFLCFMMLEESKEEVERLRQIILKSK